MDVGEWLRGLDLGRYEMVFREHAIDMDVLADLTDEELAQIGVPLGDRKRLLKAIRSQSKTEPSSSSREGAPSGEAGLPATPAAMLLAAGREAERRPITVMFCDLAGSTAILAALDAEDWRNLVSAYLDAASAAVTQMGGRVAKKLGDGLMALFGYPFAQENDSERAVRAALGIQRALAELNRENAGLGRPELVARIGVESGAVVVDGDGEVFGDAPNIAARVQALAEPGTVLITARVQRQVAGLFVAEDRGAHALKGVPELMRLFRIARASGGGRRRGARAPTPLVGRAEELDLLQRRWERARSGEGQLALIVGEPGIGKSRLIEEFHARLREAPHTWVEWSCSQLLQNTALHPFAEWGRQRFGVEVPAERRLADLEGTLRLVGLDPAEYAPLIAPIVDIALPASRGLSLPPKELRRRQLAAIVAWVLSGARSQALVLAIEDLHWADPTSLDLMQALLQRVAQAPLFILATARPEFRPPWSLRSQESVISLSPLDRADVARMVGQLAVRRALSAEVIESVRERTGGVPLFVEEVTRLLLERGEDDSAHAIPPTLQQSLAARLDRLGEAREIAQIGAVLGRDFSHALLGAVAGIDNATLCWGLERLADADILFVEGAPPQATYRFKHALIQDAAYESLLKSRRQALHRRAAEIFGAEPWRAATEPEVIAHHFTEAGLDDLAIEWWGRAGDQALRRSAFQEAISHLGKAIEMANRTGEGASDAASESASVNQRLKLQTGLGQALMFSRGFAAEESRAAFARALELAGAIDNPTERFTIFYGVWTGNLVRGELRLAREIAETFLREAERAGRTMECRVGGCLVGLTCLLQGDFVEARSNLDEALSTYDPERDREARFRFGMDIGCARVYLAVAKWLLGEIGPARGLIEEAVADAIETGHVPSLVNTYAFKSHFEMIRGDVEAAQSDAQIVVRLSQENALPLYATVGALRSAWASARLDSSGMGATEFRQALSVSTEQGDKLFAPFCQGLLAELEAPEDPEGALTRVDGALALAGETEEHWSDAFLHRLRGEILLRRAPARTAPAEEAFLTAIAVAQEQKARSLELRAALDLARLYNSMSRPAVAHTALAPALEGFSPTPEMPEIAEAQTLLAVLAETEEVKTEEAKRKRLLHLQTVFGNALIAARGYAAPETIEAFARARESAAGDSATLGRLTADFGLWAGSFVRGELSPMRTQAETFLSDVEASPKSPEAGAAHRSAGATHWFAGEYVEARDHLEQALALFKPGRDDDLAFRFGQDAGVAAMFYLALTLWPLGDVERAISLVDGAHQRIATLSHVGTRAYGSAHAAIFELMRGDRVRAAEGALELARLAHEHDLTLWRVVGVILEGLASAHQNGAAAGALEDARHGLQLLREQNFVTYDGLFKIALADAEARAGDVERALVVLDEALATCERTGHRTFEAELHRVRGEMALKRDPANLATVEERFQTAIAVARRQATRTFELRAALSLATLWQSIGRLAEGHAVLARALEGFSPAAEMPEIAEAQALLECLAPCGEARGHTEADPLTVAKRRLPQGKIRSSAAARSRGVAVPS